MPPWNAAGPSAPLATYCNSPIGPTPARNHAVRNAAQMSRVPAISPPQKIGCKFIRNVFLPQNGGHKKARKSQKDLVNGSSTRLPARVPFVVGDASTARGQWPLSAGAPFLVETLKKPPHLRSHRV